MPSHDVEIQGYTVFCKHCTCHICAPAREMASASEKLGGTPPSESVKFTWAPPIFKVGDYVRIAHKVERDSKGRNCFHRDAFLGCTGRVEEVNPLGTEHSDGALTVLVRHFDGSGMRWWSSPEALDLIAQEDV